MSQVGRVVSHAESGRCARERQCVVTSGCVCDGGGKVGSPEAAEEMSASMVLRFFALVRKRASVSSTCSMSFRMSCSWV